MKKSHISVPEPASEFLKIVCGSCKETRIVYSHASTIVTCGSCGNEIAKPTGSRAEMMGDKSD